MGFHLKCNFGLALIITTHLVLIVAKSNVETTTTATAPFFSEERTPSWVMKREIKSSRKNCNEKTQRKGATLIIGNSTFASSNVSIDTKINETINMFLKGESQIVMSDSDEVIIILGISGSGKSTLLQFLTGDNDKLIAIKICNAMIIKDGNNKIGSSTKSHTKIPELSIDNDGNNFYDCPGFKDTNDPIYDIASGYFIKKVFDHAKKVKLLFTISHSKVLYGNDRGGFISLVDQIFDLIPEINKFNESIALIVTKVDRIIQSHDEDDMPIFLSDEEKIEDIADFLESVKLDYEDLIDLKGKEKVEYVSNLINNLLLKEGENFTRIGLFNRPFKEGPLSKDSRLQASKKKLQFIINNNLQYANKNIADIQYSISDNSKLYLNNFQKNVLALINVKKVELGTAIASSFLYSYDDIEKVSAFQNDLSSVISSFADINQYASMQNSSYILEAYVKLRNVLKNMDNFDADEEILTILNLIKFLHIIKSFIPIESSSLGTHISRFSDIEQFLEALENWYLFTEQLTSYLSEYEMQSVKMLYIIKGNSVWKTQKNTEEEFLTRANFIDFFQKLPPQLSYARKSFNLILNTEPKFNDLLYQQVIDILSYTLIVSNKNLTIETKQTEVFVYGDFILLSEAMKIVAGTDYKYLNIFAYNKIFIDEDVTMNDGKHLSILAPVWDIVRKVEIRLNGKHGESQLSAKASNGLNGGMDGHNGKHGTSGYPSGNFIGFGIDITNGEFLSITTRGGDGGNGQNGGDGSQGRIGQNAGLYNTIQNHYCHNKIYTGLKFSEISHPYKCDNYPFWDSMFILIIKNDFKYMHHCVLHGSMGSKGGNGGKGGNSGFGGSAGEIVLQFQGKETYIMVNQQPGKNGRPGFGGQGGHAGSQNIHRFTAVEINNYYIINLFEQFSHCFRNLSTSKIFYQHGSSGLPGKLSGTKIEKTEIHDMPYYINEYKKHAYPRMIQGKNKQHLAQFIMYAFLRVNDQYKLLDFANELVDLEKIDNSLKQKPNIKKLYDSVLKRFKFCTKNVNGMEDKKLTAYINSVFLSQSYNYNILKLKHVTDIHTFITYTKEKIMLYEKSELNHLKSEAKFAYKIKIEKNIKDTKDFIKINVQNVLTTFKSELETSTLLSMKDLLDLQHSAMKHKHELQRILHQQLANINLLQRFEKLHKVLEVFSGIFSVVSVMSMQYIKFTESSIDIGILDGMDSHEFLSNTPIFTALKDITGILNDVTENTKHKDTTTTLIYQLQQRYNLNNEDLILIENEIKSLENRSVALHQFKGDIQSKILPWLNEVKEDILTFSDKLDENSHVKLNIKNWQIQKHLKDIQTLIEKYMFGFKIESKMVTLITEFKHSIDLLIALNDQIQIYHEEQNLYEYLSVISSTQVQAIRFNDPAYSNAASRLENIIHSNVISSLYSQLLLTVKQHVFPYAESYVQFEQITTNMTTKETLLHEKAFMAIKQINFISDELTRKKITIISGQDKDVFTGDFHSKFIISSPFYIWSDILYNNEISRFLSGEEITLKANIFASEIKNAVKFNNIALDIKAKNNARQNDLDHILNHYIVRMKHSGNSYYKCDSQYFVIKSESQVFEYSYEQQNNKTPIYQNEVFRKISSGDLLLSPYTEWKLQLIDQKSNGFNDLGDFLHEVNLELVGNGQYIRDNAFVCESNLQQFYTKYENKDNRFERSIQDLRESIELDFAK